MLQRYEHSAPVFTRFVQSMVYVGCQFLNVSIVLHGRQLHLFWTSSEQIMQIMQIIYPFRSCYIAHKFTFNIHYYEINVVTRNKYCGVKDFQFDTMSSSARFVGGRGWGVYPPPPPLVPLNPQVCIGPPKNSQKK